MTRPRRRLRILACAAALALPLAGCAPHLTPAGAAVQAPAMTAGAFVMADGTRLPYRVWAPAQDAAKSWAVVLALHGINDSRDAFEYPAPVLAAAGVLVIAPDQRGFGATADRGFWPGADTLVDDAASMAALVRRRYPDARLYLLGESMGAAVLMCLAANPDHPPADGWIFSAPAVWGRSEFTFWERAGLFLAYHLMPGARFSSAPGVRVTASDNYPALVRLSRDPLSIHATRIDVVHGLVDLMDDALRSAPRQHERALYLYGGEDQLVPKRAMRALWRTLPPRSAALAYYPHGYHLLLRDLDRVTRLRDMLSFMRDPAETALPSGATLEARAWLDPAVGGKRPGEMAGGLPLTADSGYAPR
jgi:alpha-beta hydrolase superfamily lysophospholipase